MLQRLNKRHATGSTEISDDALSLLGDYTWPGNVRELENALHSASVVSKGKRILAKDLPQSVTSSVSVPASRTNVKTVPVTPQTTSNSEPPSTNQPTPREEPVFGVNDQSKNNHPEVKKQQNCPPPSSITLNVLSFTISSKSL